MNSQLDKSAEPPVPRLFNSDVETGLRIAFLLDAGDRGLVDLERLVSYDYLLVHAARHREGGNLWFRENPDAMAADFRPLSTIYEGKIAGAYFSVLLVKEPNGETYSVSLISMPERFDLSSVRETPTASTNVRNPMLFWILAR